MSIGIGLAVGLTAGIIIGLLIGYDYCKWHKQSMPPETSKHHEHSVPKFIGADQDCRNCKYGKYSEYWETMFCYFKGECKDMSSWDAAPIREDER